MGTIPTPSAIRSVTDPATASVVSASTPREKCVHHAEPNPAASAARTSSTISGGAIGAPRTSPPTPIAIRTPP